MKKRASLTLDELKMIAVTCARKLDEKKAEDTRLLEVIEVNPHFDFFIITSGNSQVHCRSLARDIEKYLVTTPLRSRNKPDINSGWIILDYDDIVVHIFTHELRDYYQLEKLWADGDHIEYEA
jgi:ribosome-associated protein